MRYFNTKTLAGAVALALSSSAFAGSDIYFFPLTQSSAVASPNHVNELNNPWQVPAGMTQKNLTSMSEIEADINQSVVRAPAGRSSSMWDMVAFDPSGEYIFIPHETPIGAGVSRYSVADDTNHVLFSGDQGGAVGDWSNDYAAFDPARFTPNGTVFAAEEWSGEGRVIEIMNPFADPADIEIRELQSIANVAHEGINFSNQFNDTIYYIDEWNSGSFYKFVMKTPGDYTEGQTFVLVIDDYTGAPEDYWNDPSNAIATRTGMATWVPITDADGNPLTATDPFRNGPTNDPRTNSDTRGGRVAADEVGGTPYGRPEDMEVATLDNGNEVVYIAVTSERTIYSVEILGGDKAKVGVLASADTAKNVGFLPTTGTLNSPDNLAQDALGNIYIIEDAPNSSPVGGDIWFVRDADNDGVAESLDHFMSIQADGSEATGMIFNPTNPTQFVVAVQHPDSTDLAKVPNGFGDAMWVFDVAGIVEPGCKKLSSCDAKTANFVKELKDDDDDD